MAVMCIAASGLFLVCSLPSIVLLIGKPYWDVPKGKNSAYQARLLSTYYCSFIGLTRGKLQLMLVTAFKIAVKKLQIGYA